MMYFPKGGVIQYPRILKIKGFLVSRNSMVFQQIPTLKPMMNSIENANNMESVTDPSSSAKILEHW